MAAGDSDKSSSDRSFEYDIMLRGRERLFHDDAAVGGNGKNSLASIIGKEMFICEDDDRLRKGMMMQKE